MTRTVAWTDGSTWTADEATFRRVTERLEATRESIAGVEPMLDRWTKLAAAGERIDVDAFAPTELDRAIFTASLARALEQTRVLRPEDLGIEEPAEFAVLLEKLRALHHLFMTDITYELPKKRR